MAAREAAADVAGPFQMAVCRGHWAGALSGTAGYARARSSSSASSTTAPNSPAGSIRGVSTTAASWHIARIIATWALVFIASVILQRFTILLMTRAGESVQFEFRRKIFAQLQRLSMSFYDRTKLGRIISRCTSDVNSLREVNVWGIWQLVANGMIMIVAAAIMLHKNVRLFLAVVWLGPVLYLLTRVYHRKSANLYQIAREGFTRVSTNLAENITGMRVVTAFNRQDPISMSSTFRRSIPSTTWPWRG